MGQPPTRLRPVTAPAQSGPGPEQIGPEDAAGYEAQFGYQTDAATGLVLAGHRYYQPQTRRWLNRDPIGYAGGMNLFEYAGMTIPSTRLIPAGINPRAMKMKEQLE